MYSTDFSELVNFANYNSENLSFQEKQNGNPYYIGFGNPNSKVLILGKEKGFDIRNQLQCEYESLNNAIEWKHYLNCDIPFTKEKYYKSQHYINAFIPYVHKNKAGHTWTKYEAILRLLYPEITGNENDFFNFSFLSEINYQPSRLSKIKKFEHSGRLQLLSHGYFKSFPIVILGCGNYLSQKQIEEIFDVTFSTDLSKPRQKLKVFKSGKRILVQTRQLSFDVSKNYLLDIANQITPFK